VCVREIELEITKLFIDISPNNVLQGITDSSALSEIEEGEISQPIARKALSGRTIYNSRPMPVNAGLPVLCDFSEARVGSQKHKGDVMPGIYRAPEVILDMDWDCKLDIWSIGVTVRRQQPDETDECMLILVSQRFGTYLKGGTFSSQRKVVC
jgi:hypothetical protein